MMIQALALVLMGGFTVFYALKSLIRGAIDIGGKHQPFVARYTDEPGLFIFGVLFMLVLGIGCVGAGWQMLKKSDD